MARNKEEKIYQPEDAFSGSVNVKYKFWKAFQIAAINADLSLRDAMRDALADWIVKVSKRKKGPHAVAQGPSGGGVVSLRRRPLRAVR